LEACEGCYTQKLSFQTRGWGWRKKNVMEERGVKTPRESSEIEEESNVSGREWLKTFITMKVGLPRHIKLMAELRQASLGAKLTSHRMTSRMTGLEAKKWLNKLHEFQRKLLCLLN